MHIHPMAAALFQPDAVASLNTRLLMIFVGIAAAALLAQAVVMVVLAVLAAKAQKKIMGQVDDINQKLLPLLDKSNTLVADLTPQIKDIANRAQTISAHAEEISGVLRDKMNEFGPTISAANETVREANQTARDANQRTRQQVVRVDGMVSSVLDAAAQAGRAIQQGITTPVREVSNIIDALKTGITTFISGNRR